MYKKPMQAATLQAIMGWIGFAALAAGACAELVWVL
jgi:hypothetical protein